MLAMPDPVVVHRLLLAFEDVENVKDVNRPELASQVAWEVTVFAALATVQTALASG